MKTINPITAVTIAFLMSSPLALAQTATGSTQNGSNELNTAVQSQRNNARLSSADRNYLEQDARGAAYELQISQLATQKATNQQVRQYATMAVNDHQNYNQKEQQIAEQNGLTLPTSPSQKEQSRMNDLQRLNGSAFDNAYVRDMRQVNQRDINEDQKEANSTQNSQIKQFVEQFKQMDQKHLQDAKNLPISGANKG